MKKYIVAFAVALFGLAGPAMQNAQAQVFYRGGPTMIDRLMGNGYSNYGYGGYGAYPGVYNANYYGNPYRNCHRYMGNYNYGRFYGNPYHYHHHHRHW